jgi:hypothetical protein
VPDATTIWLFREALAEAGLIDKLFERFGQHLEAAGYIARGGQIVDATIVSVPKPSRQGRELLRRHGQQPGGTRDERVSWVGCGRHIGREHHRRPRKLSLRPLCRHHPRRPRVQRRRHERHPVAQHQHRHGGLVAHERGDGGRDRITRVGPEISTPTAGAICYGAIPPAPPPSG